MGGLPSVVRNCRKGVEEAFPWKGKLEEEGQDGMESHQAQNYSES